MTKTKLISKLREPTTIHGLAVILAGVAAAVLHFAGQNALVAGVCAWVIYGSTHILVPDNSADPSSVEKLVQDAVAAVVQKRVGLAVPGLLTDVQAAFASLQAPAPAPVPVPAPAPVATS